jgi:hypothetical protein
LTTRCSILVGRKKTVFDTDAHENKRKKKKAGSRTPVSRVRAPPLLAVPRKKSAELHIIILPLSFFLPKAAGKSCGESNSGLESESGPRVGCAVLGGRGA